jgi:hypothetical protein
MGPQSSTTNELTFKVPGNEIPNWFNHQGVGSSISFWVGPGFPKFALCLLFGTKDYSFQCFVDISINGRTEEFSYTFFHKQRYDHLWFYWSPDSFQWLFKDLNHVELWCRTDLVRNAIKRIGVYVECICPQVTKTIFDRRLSPSLLKSPTCISRTPKHNLCPTQTTSRRLLLKLKPRKVISKRNWALHTRSCKYLYGTQACTHCPNYSGSTFSPESTSGFDLGSSPLAHPSGNHFELFCKTTSSIEPTTLLQNMIKRIGVHVGCIFPQITKTIFHRPSLLRGPTRISRTLNHKLCPTQTTSRRLLLKLKPRKPISKRNWALHTRICKDLFGTQACSHCRNYLPRVARIQRNRLQALIWVHLHWHSPL